MAQRNVNNARALWRRAVKRNLADLVSLPPPVVLECSNCPSVCVPLRPSHSWWHEAVRCQLLFEWSVTCLFTLV